MIVLLIIGRGLKSLSLSYCDICEQWKKSHLESARIDSRTVINGVAASARTDTSKFSMCVTQKAVTGEVQSMLMF